MSQQLALSQDRITMVQEHPVQEHPVQEHLIMAQEQLTRRPMTSAERDRLERRMYPEDKALLANGQSIDHAVEGVELDIAMEALRESMTHRAMARDQARKISRDFRNR